MHISWKGLPSFANTENAAAGPIGFSERVQCLLFVHQKDLSFIKYDWKLELWPALFPVHWKLYSANSEHTMSQLQEGRRLDV